MSALVPTGRGYHFCAADMRLGYGDGREIRIGEALSVDVTQRRVQVCNYGLHCSEHVADALQYAQGPVLQWVEYGGQIMDDGDKLAAEWRRPIAIIYDTEPLLCKYARWCAWQVIHLWSAPDVVRQWLLTGDEQLRAAAWNAARAAATAAAWDAAMDAARDAARAAAWAAAWDAAWDAAGDAAWDAAWDAQRAYLARLVDHVFALGELHESLEVQP